MRMLAFMYLGLCSKCLACYYSQYIPVLCFVLLNRFNINVLDLLEPRSCKLHVLISVPSIFLIGNRVCNDTILVIFYFICGILCVCVLFREPAAGLGYFFALHESCLRVPYDCFMMGHIGCSASRRAILLMSASVRDAMSPMVISVAMASPPRPRLLPCLERADRIPRRPCSPYYVTRLDDLIVHVLEECMVVAGAVKGRDLHLEVRRIRSGASRDRHGDFVWLDCAAPHNKHLV
jgi:hypothetical protein